jgi:predicted SprT family Zn-dependent metalloprotease
VRRRDCRRARRPERLARLARWLATRLGARRKTRALRVVFNSRLRTAVGRADFSTCTIELNARLLDRHPEELLPTLVHELCHFVAGSRAGHGPRWRQAVVALGYRPETCHRLDVSDLAVRRRAWTWSCRAAARRTAAAIAAPRATCAASAAGAARPRPLARLKRQRGQRKKRRPQRPPRNASRNDADRAGST